MLIYESCVQKMLRAKDGMNVAKLLILMHHIIEVLENRRKGLKAEEKAGRTTIIYSADKRRFT